MIMKTKIITALVAFFATFIFSVGLALYFTPIDVNQVTAFKLLKGDRRASRQISNILRVDDNFGAERREKYADIEVGVAVKEYANKAAQINIDGLPPEFQNAWLKHMIAWHNYADFRQDLENPKLRNNYDESQLNRINSELNSKINSTWKQVIQISKMYGAEIPEDAE